MTLAEALDGKEIPHEIKKALVLLRVPFYTFGGEVATGDLIVHEAISEDTQAVFAELLNVQFPIEKMVHIKAYGWDDDASMAGNNTSAFNYRVIAGTDQLSNHALGRAIDINPRINPFVSQTGNIYPPGATYDPSARGAITYEIASLFKRRGFAWGGDWTDRKDWQHFEKI